MRLNEVRSEDPNVTRDSLFRGLERLAAENGSVTSMDGMRIVYREFDRIVLRGHSMRFAVKGAAREFMKSKQAKAFIEEHGWMISKLEDKTDQYGFNEDGSPRMITWLGVRLEDAQEGQKAYHVPSMIYHVTPSSNVSSIVAKGLQPRDSSRPAVHDYKGRIHFAKTMDGANAIGRMLVKHDDVPYALLSVDTSKLGSLFEDPEFKDGVFTKEAVPPDAIVKKQMVWEPEARKVTPPVW